MEVVIKDSQGPDPLTGLYGASNGGTEQMYRGLMERLSPDLKQKFQIICTRFGQFEQGKIPILWIHDMVEDQALTYLNNPAIRDQFAKIVFVSNTQFHDFNIFYNMKYQESMVLHNAIVPIEYRPKPTDRVNLIYNASPNRGLEILIPVFIELYKMFDDIKIHLDIYSSFELYGWVSRDEPYRDLFDLARNHPGITYHGYQPNAVVREALQKAHILAYPCTYKETSCLSAIEAMSAGCALVVPDYAALSETLSPWALFYRYHENPQAHALAFASRLHNAIQNIRNPNVEQHMAAQSRFANNFFSWDFRIIQWEHLLRSIDEKKENG